MNLDNSDNEKKKKAKASPAKKKQTIKKQKSPSAVAAASSGTALTAAAAAACEPHGVPSDRRSLPDLNFVPAPAPENAPAFNLSSFLSSGNIPSRSGFNGSPARISNLSAFGLAPSPTSSTVINKDGLLMCVVIDSPNGAYIIFRAVPVDERGGSLGEKYLFDAIRVKEPNWCDSINMNKSCLHWFENNIQMLNNRGYPIREFTIHLGTPGLPEPESVFSLAEYVCQQVNGADGNNTTTRVDRNRFYWIPRGECCWYDIIGWDAALRKLIRKTGPPNAGYFERNLALIRSFFREGTLPEQLAAFIHAPESELHPSLRRNIAPPEASDNDEDDGSEEDGDHKPSAESAADVESGEDEENFEYAEQPVDRNGDDEDDVGGDHDKNTHHEDNSDVADADKDDDSIIEVN